MTHKRLGRRERERRQNAAAERQKARDKRSSYDQGLLLDTRPGDSRRERARLEQEAAS